MDHDDREVHVHRHIHGLEFLGPLLTNVFQQFNGKLDQILQGEQNIMSKITDWAAQEQADLSAISATLDSIVTGIAALDKLITDFQNSPGTLSPEDQAALDAIQTASKAVVAKASAISTAAPGATPPAGGV